MGLLQEIIPDVGWLKASIIGPQGAGKTFTAAVLACEVHRRFKCQMPVVAIDTEGGLRMRAAQILDGTGMAPVALFAREMGRVMQALHEAQDAGHEVVIADSVTHIWRAVMASYQAGLAQRLNKDPKDVYLGLDDIGKIKDIWAPFSEFFTSCSMHMIVCGRLGFEWDNVENERGKVELRKMGTKMKAETEFGYESDISFEMELVQEEHPRFAAAKAAGVVPDGVDRVSQITCTKDRWDLMMGRRAFNPTGDYFAPVLSRLVPRAPIAIDLDPGVADLTDSGRSRYRSDKKIAIESIENNLIRAFPSTGGKDRAAKLDMIEAGFGEVSWAAAEARPLADLLALVKPFGQACAAIRRGEKLEDVCAALAAQRDEIFPPSDPGAVDAAANETAAQMDDVFDAPGGGMNPSNMDEQPMPGNPVLTTPTDVSVDAVYDKPGGPAPVESPDAGVDDGELSYEPVPPVTDDAVAAEAPAPKPNLVDPASVTNDDASLLQKAEAARLRAVKAQEAEKSATAAG